MPILSNCLCTDVLAILVAVVVGIATYYKWAWAYWKRRNMPCLSYSFPFGSMQNPMLNAEAFGEQTKKQYEECKAKGHKHIGMFFFSIPFYMPIDPEYIKNIMTKDFSHFVDRGAYYNEKDDPLSAHLFSIEGARWKNLRAKLTPTFTSGKMKMMFKTLTDCGEQLQTFMETVENKPVNIKDVLGCFTTDVIGSAAFGLNCNSFEDPQSEFRKYLKRVIVATKLENLKNFIAFSMPNLCRFFRVQITPKEVSKFIMGVVNETVEFREKNNVIRNDFMQILLDLKNKSDEGLTIDEVAAQAFIFLLAGYETSSTTMTFCLFELATNPDIQQRVREEINSVLENHGGHLTYDAIMEMKYMGQVIDETLRKYPPLSSLARKCVVDYKVPGTDLVLEKGMSVVIPIIGLHHDEKYFPDPEKFDPERFSDKNKSKIIPFTYMPFGEGPRICIGLRFGIMQTKVGLAVLLKNYIFSLNVKTNIPLKYDPASFILSTLGDIWLNVERVK